MDRKELLYSILEDNLTNFFDHLHKVKTYKKIYHYTYRKSLLLDPTKPIFIPHYDGRRHKLDYQDINKPHLELIVYNYTVNKNTKINYLKTKIDTNLRLLTTETFKNKQDII